MSDIAKQLMSAADNIDEMSRTELQVLLRLSAETIKRLRELIQIRDDILLEDEPPAGNA